MKCLPFRQSINVFTISVSVFSLLFFYCSTTQANPYNLPNEIKIKVGKTLIRGFFGDPSGLKEAAEESTDNLPAEGFVYRVESGPEARVQLAVWSTSRREAQILKAAEAKLTDLVYAYQSSKGEVPGGFLFDGVETSRVGRESARIKNRVDRSPPLMNELAPVMANVIAQDPQSLDEPRVEDLSKTDNTALVEKWTMSTSQFYWIFATILALIGMGLAWGAAQKS